MVNKYLKKVDEKTVLFAVFILLAILALGSLVFMNNKLGLTGHAVFEQYENEIDCVGANYTWEVLTNETCITIEGCEIGVTGCVDTCEECEDVITGQECSDSNYITQEECEIAEETWNDIIEQNCTDIPDCEIGVTGCVDTCEECEDIIIGGQCTGDICDSTHLTLCLTLEECEAVEVGGYWYNDACNAEAECVPDCSGLECGDDGCGGDCGTCDSGYSCVDGDCESDDDTSSDDSSADVTGATIDGMKKSSCVSNWECEDWTECVDGMQTTECIDTNHCVTPTDIPAMSLPCEGVPKTPETSETCSDGIRNQDEKGIDCGGVCEQRCSFFTIMGNAVNVPINSSKQFIKNNKAISFSILGLIVLAVGWIVCVKVFLKKKNIFFFLENLDLSKCLAFFKGKKTD